ncbi:MAG: prepilin-type N-terminal cleavage/methylation domain-containing protein, partial [Candidatus Nealsonbacteria bacterium]|nr:prepilin-type N-terminal cleavage/methylation domain-containing protein [Candidatus Nealsonbacteria bacterium]
MNKNMKNKGFTPLEIERKRKRSRFLTGFTLIELLVVVVVIGVLAGMSFVMIHGVIDAARMARSKSFSKSIQLQLALNEVGVWRFDDDPVIPAVRGVHDASGWGNHGTLHLGP